MELRGIEPRTSPMLREYYTTKPQPHLLKYHELFVLLEANLLLSADLDFREMPPGEREKEAIVEII